MHNFDDLQKRYKKYRVKKAMKYILVFFVIFLSAILYLSSQIDKKPALKAKTILKKSTLQEMKRTTVIQTKSLQKEHTPITTDKSKEVKKVDGGIKRYYLQFLVTSQKHIKQLNEKKKRLESLGFKDCKLIQPVVYLHLVCDESNTLKGLESYIELAKKNHIDYYIFTHNSNIKERKEKEQNKQIEKIEKSPAPILQVENTNAEQLQENFSQSPNYNTAIIIARSYYKKESFKNAIIWVKKANQLDKSDAESWIIYAKSLYALHQEDKAQQLLHIYLQYENSEEVDKLLKSWEKNQ